MNEDACVVFLFVCFFCVCQCASVCWPSMMPSRLVLVTK